MSVAQLCPTLCDLVDCSPPGSSVHGILQARILDWVAFPSPGDLPDPGIKPGSPTLQADSLLSESPGKPHRKWNSFLNYINSALVTILTVLSQHCDPTSAVLSHSLLSQLCCCPWLPPRPCSRHAHLLLEQQMVRLVVKGVGATARLPGLKPASVHSWLCNLGQSI